VRAPHLAKECMTAVVVKSHRQTANGITIPPVVKLDVLMDSPFMTHPVRTLHCMADYAQAHFEPGVLDALIR
jgi:hypothetical protein